MVLSNDPPTDDGSESSLHEKYFEPLVTLVLQNFPIPRVEAEALVHEVLVGSIRHIPAMTDVQTWLTAAVTSAARRRMENP